MINNSSFKNGFYLAFVITFILFLYHNFYNFEDAPFWEPFTETKAMDSEFISYSGGVKYSLINVISFSSKWLLILTLFFAIVFSLIASFSNAVTKKNKSNINAYHFTRSTWSTEDESLKYRFMSNKILLRIKDNIPEEGSWQYFDPQMTTVVISLGEEKSILTRVSSKAFLDKKNNITLYSN